MASPEALDRIEELYALIESSPRRDSPAVKRFIAKSFSHLNHLPHAMAVVCALADLQDRPSCPFFPNEHVVFLPHLRQFAPVGPTAWKLVKHDTHIKTKWLTWESLLRAGLPYDAALERLKNKRYYLVREFFSGAQDVTSIMQTLVSDFFTIERAQDLVNELKLDDWLSIDLFSEQIGKIKTARNTDIEYFTLRGHPLKAAKALLLEFFQRGSTATKKRVEEDPEYRAWFRRTRLPGLIAQQRHSKMEREIGEELIRRQVQVEHLTTHITSESDIAQLHDRSWFSHDFFLPSLNLIVEYNGVHWHRDRQFELEKAAYVTAVTGKRYMALWEGDLSSAEEYVDFILAADEMPFVSTSPEEEVKFIELVNGLENRKALDDAFLDVAERLAQLSKCQSKKVCALAVRNGRIVGTGLNGTIEGWLNCCDVFPNGVNEVNRLEHRAWSAMNEIHAEESLIGDMAARGGGLQGCTIYVNLQPCQKCSLYLTRVGAQRIVYRNEYDFGNSAFSRSLFKRCKILFNHQPRASLT